VKHYYHYKTCDSKFWREGKEERWKGGNPMFIFGVDF
jgi:hypothetical protein